MEGSDEDERLVELRRAVLDDPRNCELRYLLGAQMAQRHDYGGAVLELSAAIAHRLFPRLSPREHRSAVLDLA